MLTFSTAVGAIAMKTTAAPILRRFGFRQVLVINAVVSAVFIGVPALFTPMTPHGLILLVLLAGGFFKSLQFTSVNTLAYADIEPRAMSAATSFASVAQQLSMSAGVAVGALVLEFQRHGRADTAVHSSDFITAFIVIGIISAASALIFMQLPKSAGASLAGPARPVGTPQTQVAEAEVRADL
jgi:MFS family permease